MKFSTLTAGLLVLVISTITRAEHYQIVTEEWAPYNYLENDQLAGITTDIVQAIMALTGDNFKVEVLPSMRATRALNEQPRTIMYSLFRTAEREPLYKWVGPIVEDSIHPYQLASAPQQIYSLAQLMNAPRITTRNAGLLPDLLESLGFDNLDKSATKNQQLYRMLIAGRTDIIIGDTDGGVDYYSRQLDIAPDTLRQIPIEIYRASLYIAFSRDSEDEVVAAWAEALEQLREAGELARIQLRYAQIPAP